MSKISVQVKNNVHAYLSEISEMKVTELEFFAQELNALITRKRSTTKDSRIGKLYQLIDTTILEHDKQIILNTLAEKIQNETMTQSENTLYLKLAKEEAELRNQRVAYMIELSQLRNISFPQLMSELGLKPLPNA